MCLRPKNLSWFWFSSFRSGVVKHGLVTRVVSMIFQVLFIVSSTIYSSVLGTSLLWTSTMAFTYWQIKSAKCLCLLLVVLVWVLLFWSLSQESGQDCLHHWRRSLTYDIELRVQPNWPLKRTTGTCNNTAHRISDVNKDLVREATDPHRAYQVTTSYLQWDAEMVSKQAVGGRPPRYAPAPLLSPSLWAPKRLAPQSRRQRSSSFRRPTRSHVHRYSRLTRQHGGDQSGLVTLTFDFWPWKWCTSHVWRGLPLCQF